MQVDASKMLTKLPKLFVLTVFSTLVIRAETEKYTNYAQTTVGLGELLRIEFELIGQLEKYEENLIEKLELTRLVIRDLRAEHQKSISDPDLYLSNPLNSFALVRRTHDDWLKWHDLVQQLAAKPQIDFLEELKAKLPTADDVEEAVTGIVRIQQIYELSADEMANGVLNGKQYAARLSALDCYAIGEYLRSEWELHAAIEWFNAAKKLYATHDDMLSQVLDFDEAEIWYALWDSLIHSYKHNEAYAAIQRAVQLRPNEELFLEQKDSLRQYLSHNRLCRNGITQTSRLHCRYNSTTTPFLRLAPFKMEEIALDPYIVLYHDVIYDSEIEELQSIALPNMTRGGVGRGEVDPDRTTQIWDISLNDSALIPIIYRRYEDMSGLDWSTRIEVVNYGLGGHYFSHTDYVNLTLNPDLAGDTGDRIAALLIYLSDVEVGGGTAFPEVDVVVQPKKGSALMWYHLDNAGNGNPKSLHAGCPVLLGSKWIAIKLAFHWPQMFKKPCYKEDN